MNGDLFTTWAGETILSVTILMAIVMLIRRPVGQIFGPQIAYMLWAIPAARMLMPVLTITVEAPPETAAPVADLTAPIMLTEDTLAAVQQGPAFYEQPLFWFTLWLGGAALFLIYQLGSYITQRDQLLADAVPVGKAGNIELIEVAQINGPFAFGLMRKYIVLPIGFEHRYNHAQRALVLQHEIAHHRAGDLWVNAAALGILSLHWFNPVAWLAWRQFRFDQEAACDARVISHQPVRQKQLYSAAIAQTATGRSLALASPLISKNKLKERIRIMSMKEKTGAQKTAGRLLVGGGMVSALALTATVTYAVQSAPPVPPAEPVAPLAMTDMPAPPAVPGAVPSVPAAPVPPAAMTNIDTVDIWSEKDSTSGKKVYVHKIKGNGRTIILRMDRKLSDEEVAEMVQEAEESRQEADEARQEAREHRLEMREMEREIERDVEMAMREAGLSEREARAIARQARTEAMAEANEARAEAVEAMAEARAEAAEAMTEARVEGRRETRSIRIRVPARPVPAAQPPQPPIPAPAPVSFMMEAPGQNGQMRVAVNMTGGKNIRNMRLDSCKSVLVTPSTRTGVMTETAYASVVRCTGLKPGKNEKALLKITLDTLKQARKSYAKSCSKSIDASERQIVAAFDREIAHLARKIA